MLHLTARLQRLAACAPRMAGFPGSFSSPLPLPALCQLLSTCSSAHSQPQERMRAVQLSSLLPLAARSGQEHAGSADLQRRALHASPASLAASAAPAEEPERNEDRGHRGGSTLPEQGRRALHASPAHFTAPAAEEAAEYDDREDRGSRVMLEQGDSDGEDVAEQRRRVQQGLVAVLAHRLEVSEDELAEWGEEHVVLRSALHHDYQFSAKAFYVGVLCSGTLCQVGRSLSQQARQLYSVAAERGFPSFWNTAEWRLICLGPRPAAAPDRTASVAGETETGLPYDEPYVAVFENMDTVVFFNGCGQEAQLWQQYAGAVLPTREIEEFRVFVRPRMSNDSMILPDSIGLKAAQPDQIKTIAYLLAQTVALHFYETEVDTMLRSFQDINADMERTGELVAAMAKGELLKMVARNNVMRTGILSSKIGLTKRFDAAWRDAECCRIYEHLHAEMEITRRYEDLEVKFDLIQDNLKYFLEIIQNKKSDFLEYMIVILIAAEIFVSLFDMWTRDAFSGF